jgi:tRNA A-37 threonylcarbamoyl transferase component Bud32
MVEREPRDATPGEEEATLLQPRGEASGNDGGDEPLDDADDAPRQLGRFHVLEQLGQGGMGRVFLAEDPDLGRRVAIKLLHERVELESRGRARLEREARALAALSHPNVVHVYEIGAHEGHVFVAMERVPGQSLKVWLSERPRSWREIVEMFCAAGDGLAAAHKAGIVHRDFKPDNVLVDPEGRPRVVDFGLATPSAADDTSGDAEQAEVQLDGLTATGTVMGTPAYMSPEQHTGGPPDARSDQFSFCVALFEALFGVRPFRGATLDLLRHAVVRGRISPPPSKPIPRRVVLAVRRGLAPEPRDRHASMPELLAELREAVATSWRRPAILIGAGALALAGLIALVQPRGAAETRDANTTGSTASSTLVEPWRITSRQLTKTTAPGVDSASIDPGEARLVYASGRRTWSRALAGGTPQRVDVPGGGHPWWLTLATDDGAIVGIVDGKLWRFAGPRGPAIVLDEGPVVGSIAIPRSGSHIAAMRDEHLTIRDVTNDAKVHVDFPRERGLGAGWSADGAWLAAHTRTDPSRDLVRIFDPRGRILAWLELSGRAHPGVAWVAEDRLVVSMGTYTELSLVCLGFAQAEGRLVELGRSESVEHAYAQVTLGDATDDGNVLVFVARSIRDVAVGPVRSDASWSLLSPELEAGNRSASWLRGDRLALVSERDLQPTAVFHDLASGVSTTTDAITAPVRRVSTASDGTLVAIVEAHGSEPAAIVVMPPGGGRPQLVADASAVAAKAIDLRCESAMRCVVLTDAEDGQRFHVLELPGLELGARGPCPPSHGCTAGTFAPSSDATRVLVPTRDYKRLEWLAVDTGEVLAQGPVAPPGHEVGSGTPIPGSNDVIATMTLDSSAVSTLPLYSLARLSPDAPPQILWRTEATYLRRPVLSPDSTRVALDAATFHTEAVLVEGANRCRELPMPE